MTRIRQNFLHNGCRMHKLVRLFCSLLLLCFLPATYAIAQKIYIVDAKTLKTASPLRAIELTEAIAWQRKAQTALGSDTEAGLLPGTYDLQLLDSSGTYFLGPPSATYMRIGKGAYMVARGGVWIPAKTGARPRFFSVEEGNPRRGATLAEAIRAEPPGATRWPLVFSLIEEWGVESNRGNLVMHEEIDNEELAAKLRQAFEN